jgi:hypothetical protein
MPQGASFLRTGIELGREVSRDSGNQVIFVEGGDSFLLCRRPYDKTFKRHQYSPDPSEPDRSWLGGFRLPSWEEIFDWVFLKGEEWLEARRQTAAPAQAPAPVPQPATNADLKAMFPEDPRFAKYLNTTDSWRASSVG